jgi:CRISPR-associated protein Csd1
LEGCRVHEKPEILRKIIEKYDYTQRESLKFELRNCSICGTHKYPVEDIPHGMIKKVPNGQSSGCALVSYNENAFESYQLKGNNNSSICTNCAKTYVEGLNWLLSSGNETIVTNKKGKEKPSFRYTNRKNLGPDTAMVFWTRKNDHLPEMDQLEAPDAEAVGLLIESVKSGKVTDSQYLEPDWFYAATLSGSAARVVVRDWIETSLFAFHESVAKWFQDICIAEYDSNLRQFKSYYPGLYTLSKSCQNESESKDVTFSRVATYLWDAALKNSPLPLWILTKVLQRARLDESGVTAERAALIKIILNRNKKGGDFVIKDKIQDGDRPVAYICGQIFAKLESIQFAALGQINAGIRERYFTYSMTMPSAAFGRLFNLNSKHFTKLKNDKPGLAVMLDKELQELCKDIEISKFPATFQLEEQGQFAIGYYHQKQAQFNILKNK